MNRGADRQAIFSDDTQRQLFLNLLASVTQHFHVECHAYCLMDNYFHLLIHTLIGQLGRAMRHLNGLYTQRFNRLQERDGPLFRGRYRAILIDADTYLLAVSRYIHLNPLMARIVADVRTYPWSSYPAYIGAVPVIGWLTTGITLQMAGTRWPKAAYRAFVEQGLDEETDQFYRKARQSPILGDAAFEVSVANHRTVDVEVPDSVRPHHVPSLAEIVETTAVAFGVASESLLTSRRGRGQANPARQVALYLSREVSGESLEQIAVYFGLGHYASVSRSAQLVRERLDNEPALAQLTAKLHDKLRNHTR